MNFPPDRPFTAADARRAGVSATELRTLIGANAVTHLLHGVYVPGGWPDTPAARAQAVAAVLPEHCVVVDRSAASLHGIDLFDYAELDVPPRVEVVSVGGHTATRRRGVLGGKRALLPSDIMVVEGVPLTTPARTACDVACLRGRHRAIGALDAFRTRFDLDESDLGAFLPRFAGRRGVKQLRELIPLSATEVDSQPESWVRLDMHDAGFPMPAAQVWVWLPGFGAARVENAYEHLRLAVEFDGEAHHSSDADRAYDESRREALRRAGWVIIVVRRDGFSGPAKDRWLRELAKAFADRSPHPSPRRVYARGPDARPWMAAR